MHANKWMAIERQTQKNNSSNKCMRMVRQAECIQGCAVDDRKCFRLFTHNAWFQIKSCNCSKRNGSLTIPVQFPKMATGPKEERLAGTGFQRIHWHSKEITSQFNIKSASNCVIGAKH